MRIKINCLQRESRIARAINIQSDMRAIEIPTRTLNCNRCAFMRLALDQVPAIYYVIFGSSLCVRAFILIVNKEKKPRKSFHFYFRQEFYLIFF